MTVKRLHNGGSAWEVKVHVQDERGSHTDVSMLVVLPDGQGLTEIGDLLDRWFEEAYHYRVVSAVEVADGHGDEHGRSAQLLVATNLKSQAAGGR